MLEANRMDADQRLTALKKAYADIILNTAKEAAARIMVSERKALRCQHELYVSKEEALQMLVRLKQMMDSKISEAEMKSLNQHRKIEELEAQLQEAEDIVKDLREELREVQVELERITNNNVHHLDEYDMAAPDEPSEESRLYTSQSVILPPPESQHESVTAFDVKNSNMNERTEGHKCYNAVIHMGNSYVSNPDLPSIILRSKEPELYRNGCTQRIRACERNLLDGESLSGKLNDVKHETSVKEDEESERICKAPTHEADDICNLEKKVVQEDSRLSSWHQVRAVRSFRRTRKRGTRYGKNRTPSCRYLPDRFRRTDQAPDISCLRTNPNLVKNSAQLEEDPSKMGPRLSSDTTEMDMQLGGAETTESGAELVKACGVQNTINKGEAIIDKSVPVRQASESTESLGVPVCQMNIEKADAPLVNSESKASDTANGIPSQPVNNRVIKYTFQRKRKRESLSSSDGNASVENNTLKRKTVEKQNGSLEPQKSSLITESSRDSRRLAQVARQLISLSEKKWWQ